MGHITQIGGSGDFVKLELVQAITIVDEKNTAISLEETVDFA